MLRLLFAITVGCALGLLLAGGTFLIAGPIRLGIALVLGIAGLIGLLVSRRRSLRVLVGSIAVVLLALSNVVPWPAPGLVRDAARTAGGSPYCIQVADGIDYRPAASQLDFSPSMMSPAIEGGRAMQFYAILAVGSGADPVIYNWSYRSGGWKKEPSLYPKPVVSCGPRLSFATDLPLVAWASAPETVQMRLAGRSFTIPLSYHPKAHAADSPTLRLTIDGASGTPVECADARSCLNHWMWIYLHPVAVMRWLDEPATETTRLIDQREEPAGPVRTRIDCNPPVFNDGFNCTQHFLFDGTLFVFRMREAEVGNWHSAQQGLIGLFQGLQNH
jgi:hypothetical protein